MITIELLEPGVYRLPHAANAQAARADAVAAGWLSIELPGKEIDSKAAFLAACAKAFHFPGWFGANWDALNDSLSDLSWLGPAGGLLVLFDDAARFARSDLRSFETALEILAAACEWWQTRGMRMVVLVRGAPRDCHLRRL